MGFVIIVTFKYAVMPNNYANIGAKLPDIASLDQRITIQTFTTSRTATGSELITWVDLRTVWARAKPLSRKAGESFTADQHITTGQIEFTVRYTGDVTEKMRVIYDGDTYDILAIDMVGRRKFETYLCEVRK